MSIEHRKAVFPNHHPDDRTSLYCPSVFDLYAKIENTILASTFFWELSKQEKQAITQLFAQAQAHQIDIDLDCLSQEASEKMVDDLLELYTNVDTLYQELLEIQLEQQQ